MTGYQPEASHFVNARPVEDATGAAIEVLNPATGAPIAHLHAATDAIIAEAVESGKRAQAEWAARPPAARAGVLAEVARRLRAENRPLSELETADTGKPISETLVADAASAAEAFEHMAARAATLEGAHIPLAEGFVYTRREPIGLCAGIGAWNYPIQIAGWKAAPALAAGNALIFKPSDLAPLSALRLARIIVEAGAPPGLFNVIQGGAEVGAALAAHPEIAKLSVTGSVPTGLKVAAAAAGRLAHVTLELGGKSPMIVFGDADLDAAVSGAILGNFYSSGQICSNGTRVFVHRSLREAFLERLLTRLDRAVIGDPMDPATTFGPLISGAQLAKVLGHVETGRREGATLVTGGRRLKRPGFWMEPTVFADVSDGMTIAREEIFGPVLSLLDFDEEDDVIARANATPYGLAAGLFTRDLARAYRVAAALAAGTVWVNGYNATPAEMPFGGVKLSGIGRENGAATLDHWSTLKSVHVSLSSPEAPY